MEWRLWIETEPVATGDWARCEDALLDALEKAPGVLGPIGWGSGDTLGAVFAIRSRDLPQALALGLAAFEEARRSAAVGLEKPPGIRRLEVVDAALEPDELMGATDVARLLGISRQRVYQLSDEATFPAPAAHLARGALWSRADIEAWNDRRRPEAHARPPVAGIPG